MFSIETIINIVINSSNDHKRLLFAIYYYLTFNFLII